MKKSLLLLLSSFVSIGVYSQVTYSLELESFKGKEPKEVFEDISTNLDYKKRSIEKENILIFEAKHSYTADKINSIISSFGYITKRITILEGDRKRIIFEH
ncbi:MAG: hypothetical protein M9916_07795 [Crocinitomicaceae bacterium]|jgi:hypothetical protein|nr:hypothetical protein [Crocinitomicaceae bacterium]